MYLNNSGFPVGLFVTLFVRFVGGETIAGIEKSKQTNKSISLGTGMESLMCAVRRERQPDILELKYSQMHWKRFMMSLQHRSESLFSSWPYEFLRPKPEKYKGTFCVTIAVSISSATWLKSSMWGPPKTNAPMRLNWMHRPRDGPSLQWKSAVIGCSPVTSQSLPCFPSTLPEQFGSFKTSFCSPAFASSWLKVVT